MNKSKTIVMGICGGIAAYKCCEITRSLIKKGHQVHCILTDSGSKFITPLTLQTLSGNPVHTKMFEPIQENKIEHISLADRADLILIAPATANIIAKVVHGICDDLLSTTICASKAKVSFAPSMNVNMWNNPITQKNIRSLVDLEYGFIEPEEGMLACGYEGKGRLASLKTILDHIDKVTK